jgi:hypothetical protein
MISKVPSTALADATLESSRRSKIYLVLASFVSVMKAASSNGFGWDPEDTGM